MLWHWLSHILFPHRAREYAQQHQLQAQQVSTLIDTCSEAARQGDYAKAHSLYEEHLAAARERGDSWEVGVLLLGLSDVALRQNDYAVGRSCCEESLAIFTGMGQKRGMASALSGLAAAALYEGQYGRARLLCQESLSAFRALSDKAGMAGALGTLGLIAHRTGDHAQALSLYEQCHALYQEMEDRAGIAFALQSKGAAVAGVGDVAQAKALYEEALVLYRTQGDTAPIAAALISLGFLAQPGNSNYAQERAYLAEAIALLGQKMQDDKSLSYALNNRGNIARFEKDYAHTATLYRESLLLKQQLQDRWGIAYTLEGCAALAAAMGKAERGARLLGATAALRELLGTPREGFLQSDYDQAMDTARRLLGDQSFGTALREGRAMNWEQAVAYALEDLKGRPEAAM